LLRQRWAQLYFGATKRDEQRPNRVARRRGQALQTIGDSGIAVGERRRRRSQSRIKLPLGSSIEDHKVSDHWKRWPLSTRLTIDVSAQGFEADAFTRLNVRRRGGKKKKCYLY